MSIAQTIQRALSNVGDVDQQREVLRRALDHKVFAKVRPISWNMWKNLKSSNDILSKCQGWAVNGEDGSKQNSTSY
jgi:2-phosphoglycerate kinase